MKARAIIYVVESVEEELGSKKYNVFTPGVVSREEAFKNFEIASIFARNNFCEIDEEADEETLEGVYEDFPILRSISKQTLIEMAIARDGINGIEAFNMYLEDYCGYKVNNIYLPESDFTYVW